MTLAGELVLSRNQLNESLARQDERGIHSGAQRVSLVTSELQEVVTLTRMQPVGSLFTKFPRLVRDLARDLGKDVQLKIEGGEVEIDKTILEGLSDPLTHMVRNCGRSRHRAARPAGRSGQARHRNHHAGSLSSGRPGGDRDLATTARAWRSRKSQPLRSPKVWSLAEQVQSMSEREKMALIFLPGVSTAEKVSDVSGRGVGMDVVKTNLDRLGGKIEIDSEPGRGSRFRIKLPLTLAIIPSLLVSDNGERFAIPQVNVGELIRIPAAQQSERTHRVGGAVVMNVRDRLVPLLRLADALGVPRQDDPSQALNVVLVDTGAFEYGLVVEELHDTVEIVVKPLGRHLKGLHEYAGATILGDGRVAVILDVAGLAARANLTAGAAEAASRQQAAETTEAGELHSLLAFHNAPGENCAVPIEQVSRIERVRPAQIEYLGGRRTMQYRGASLPLVTLHDTAAVGELTEEQQWVVIVFENLGRPVGLLAAEPLDMLEASLNIDTVTLRQRGIAASAVLKDRTILLLDIFELADAVRPEGDRAGGEFPGQSGANADGAGGRRFGVLPRPGAAPGGGGGMPGADGGRRPGGLGNTGSPCRRGGPGGHRHRDAAPRRAVFDQANPRRPALCRLAGHRAFFPRRGRGDRPRPGRRRERVSNQAEQGRIHREHPEGGPKRRRHSGLAGAIKAVMNQCANSQTGKTLETPASRSQLAFSAMRSPCRPGPKTRNRVRTRELR